MSGIYVSTRGGALRRVARPARLSDYTEEPAWSTDGEWIAFHYEHPVGGQTIVSQLWRVRADGTGLKRLTTEKSDSSPAWLPSTA